jgi:hypothetical protein
MSYASGIRYMVICSESLVVGCRLITASIVRTIIINDMKAPMPSKPQEKFVYNIYYE